MLTTRVTRLFGRSSSDTSLGYRVFLRRFTESSPTLSEGFEIETEFAVHALRLRLPAGVLATAYGARPAGQREGFSRIGTASGCCASSASNERHRMFFGVIDALMATISTVLGVPIVSKWLKRVAVPRLPTVFVATGVKLLAFVIGIVGLVPQAVTLNRRELRRLACLQIPVAQAQVHPVFGTNSTGAPRTGHA